MANQPSSWLRLNEKKTLFWAKEPHPHRLLRLFWVFWGTLLSLKLTARPWRGWRGFYPQNGIFSGAMPVSSIYESYSTKFKNWGFNMLPVNRSVFIQVASTKDVKHKEDLGSWRGSRFNCWRFAKVKWGNWYHHSRRVTSFPRTHNTYILYMFLRNIELMCPLPITIISCPSFSKKDQVI